ncbi:methyltransferase domain-containing protein [Paeniglutamicibacter sp. ABSL32-1]|uniref:putative RNA methyltransferase n=1 Tax=Paeniglutamicibacter quisquiliarum TaxID=2849498 RepID=UPI001C2DF15F|nr:methyltransferase domain-containing protein [Paeniglutamicibacter quisquiliarum]MBV1778537.1 methyltransferase domain-containing protein [Paeniglutamicibacter quisquiliarum]
MNPDDGLRCPVCRLALHLQAQPGRPSRLGCDAGHAFDAAKQGYFNLLAGKGTNFREDGAQMVAARAAFLDAGHYESLAEALGHRARAALRGNEDPRILDAGAGTGYYLNQVLQALPEYAAASAVALDISRYAMRRAAKVPRTLALVWDLWRELPLEDESFDVLLNIFSPHNGSEFSRVLRPGGTALVVTPLPGHLAEGAELLGLLAIAPDKAAGVVASMGDGFTLSATEEVRIPLVLDAAAAFELAMMGPAGHHLDPGELRGRLAAAGGTMLITAAFRIQEFRRNR